ncbi:hypothetical protein [Nocardia sp. NPDC057030]|uniref:hypothetical protein n=1 Tax=unclassified Nocardia TaxID=2637762 RepID=UPI00363A752B
MTVLHAGEFTSPPVLTSSSKILAIQAVSALGKITAHDTPSVREASLRRAEKLLTAFGVALLEREAPVRGEDLPVRSASEHFFRIRETDLSPHQAALHAALAFAPAGLADLAVAPMAGADLVSETAAMGQALSDLTGISGSDLAAAPTSMHHSAANPPARAPADDTSAEAIWSTRWIIGHQIHAQLTRCAATAVQDAARNLDRGTKSYAAHRLRSAAVLVRGLPAAMAHAAAMPVDYYQQAVRPAMLPPAQAAPLSGRMQHSYRVYRKAVNALLAALPQPYPELATHSAELANAYNDFLEADLVDAERHITLAYSMVDLRRSIAQTGDTSRNAVGELRLMRHRLAARYAPHLRVGDHYIAATLAAMRHPPTRSR